MFQENISKLYKQFVRLAFNITIITLIIGLFVGIFRTVSELGLTVTEAQVLIAFVIREFMLHLFEGKLSGMDVFFWSFGIVSLIAARAISFFYRAPKG
ncbi:MAG: hypothetical protein ACO2PP_05680 [Thermocrinis sp.]|jgi:flagellar biosynthesis protein FliQ|uniref:hypothetical protein n=1 Tax=Thermocrinis sp. TaxID=2024383 RepID=UPI003C022DDC